VVAWLYWTQCAKGLSAFGLRPNPLEGVARRFLDTRVVIDDSTPCCSGHSPKPVGQLLQCNYSILLATLILDGPPWRSLAAPATAGYGCSTFIRAAPNLNV
jgi:hypothetical protein